MESIHPSKLIGNSLAETKIKGIPELCGCYKFGEHEIFYAFDEVRAGEVTKLIEHKSLQYPDKGSYFNKSLIQVALYQSLLRLNPNKFYQTAKFASKLHKDCLYIDGKTVSILNFDGTRYKVRPTNQRKIVEFYCQKAAASLTYPTARKWDEKCRNKDVDLVLQFIDYSKLKP